MSRTKPASFVTTLAGLGMYLMILAMPFLLFVLYSLFRDRRRRSEFESFLCSHGVPGGKTMRRCQKCVTEQRREELAAERTRSDEKRRRELRSQAEGLLQSEIVRLRKIRLRKFERLEKSDPVEFEEFVADLFRAKGFRVEVTPVVNDGGKDAVAYKGDKKFVIECKKYAEENGIGRPYLQRFDSVIRDEQAERGFFVTTSYFSSGAIEFARNHKIELIDRDRLVTLINETQPPVSTDDYYQSLCLECGDKVQFRLAETLQERQCPNGHKVLGVIQQSKLDGNKYPKLKLCPKCNRPLRLNDGRRGKFWGCNGYPECKFTMKYRRGEGNHLIGE